MKPEEIKELEREVQEAQLKYLADWAELTDYTYDWSEESECFVQAKFSPEEQKKYEELCTKVANTKTLYDELWNKYWRARITLKSKLANSSEILVDQDEYMDAPTDLSLLGDDEDKVEETETIKNNFENN